MKDSVKDTVRKKRRKKNKSEILRQSFRAALFTTGMTEFTQISALLIDGIIISRMLGIDEVGAVGIASPLFYLIGMLAMGFSSGVQTVCSRELGRGKVDEVNDLLNETLMVAGTIALIFFFIVYAGADLLAFFFGARGKAASLLPLTRQYLRGLSFEFVPYILMSVLTPLISMDDGSRIVLLSSVTGAVTNVLFDLIAAAAGFGVFGIGVSTALSILMSLLCLLFHFRKKNRLIRLKYVAARKEDVLEILRLGTPRAIHELAGMLRPIILNAMIVAAGGGIGMSVMTVRSYISDFVEIPSVAIAGAVGLLAGVAYGERNGEDVEQIDVLSHRTLAVASAVIFTVLFILARPVAAFFLKEEGGGRALALLTFAIRTLAAGIFFTGLLKIRISYCQVTEHTKQAQFIEAASNFALLLLCAYLLSVPFGMYGIFVAFPLSQVLTLAGIWLIYTLKTKRPVPARRDILMLDQRFYPDVSDIIEYPVVDREECVIAGRQVRLFCMGHEMDTEKAYYAALCLEEITTNIIDHGFTRANWHNAAEIRITISEDSLIMRVRDNGVEFNIKTIAEILANDEDPFLNLGIRVIAATAKKIDYYRSWGSNVTILWI